MIDKRLIKNSFSRFANKYSKEAFIQEKASKDLINIFKINFYGIGLDLGSGSGYIGKILKNKNIKLINLDISKEMLKEGKNLNIPLIQADIENLPFKNETFDFVLSSFALHWTKLEKSFSEVYRVLKKDSYFIFNIPIKNSLNFVSFLLQSEKFNFLDKDEIFNLLEINKFCIEDFVVINYCLDFKNGYELLLHLHNTGVSLNANDKDFKRKRYIVKKFKDWKEKCSLNYNVLFVKGKKG